MSNAILTLLVILGMVIFLQAIIILRLQKKMMLDPQTGLYTTRILRERRSQGKNRAVIYFDLDGFKKINDLYGHDVGDRLISWFGSILKDHVTRETDRVIRSHTAGDEFIIMLYGATINNAEAVLENIIDHLKNNKFQLREEEIEIKTSFGTAESSKFKNRDATDGELIELAEKSMRDQKEVKGAAR